MNWITTNIRFPEEEYLELKMEALRHRKSVAQLIRERVFEKKVSKEKNTEKLMRELDKVASENAKVLKGKSLSKLLIEMRYEQ